MIAMVALMGLCLWGYTEAIGGARSRPRPQRPPRKKPKVSPTKDLPPPAMVVDFNRVRKQSQFSHSNICLCIVFIDN